MLDNLNNKKILGFDDVVKFPAGNSEEKLTDVTTYDKSITARYIKPDMIAITGETIYLRDSLCKKLAAVQKNLRNKGYQLKIVYGYRHPEIQQKYFDNRKQILAIDHPDLTLDKLDKYTHNFVAIAEIAGHPAGAAVDLTLVNSDGSAIDMGTGVADYTDEEKIRTFSTQISSEQAKNRQILHDAMIGENFAPFYGEWWHFSYGDREWAAFYNKKALYGAIDFKTI